MTNGYHVLLADELVGYLHRDDLGRTIFHFASAYQRLSRRPVLGQKFEDYSLRRIYVGDKKQLPAFFANLIPEANGPLRQLLTAQLGAAPSDELALLSALGNDLPGAVRVQPGEVPPPGAAADAEPITGAPAAPSPPDADGLRFSLAGVQLKFSVLLQAEKIALPGTGELGDWIVKLDSTYFPQLAENEYATMEWARAAGFDVPTCRLEKAEDLPASLQNFAALGRNIFLIKRYDRHDGQRIHQEDFAQVVGSYPELKYEHATYEKMARLTAQIVGEAGYLEFVRRLVFMVASGNLDAHLKNWSLLYPDGVTPQLTPLYDQVTTVAWLNQLQKGWALNFAGTKNLYTVDEAAFGRLAKMANGEVSKTQRLVGETVAQIAAAWAVSMAPATMPRAHLAALQQHWRRVPLLKPHAAELSG